MPRHVLVRGMSALAVVALFWASARAGDDDEAKPSLTAKLWPGTWFAKKTPEAQKDNKGQPVKDAKADFDAARRLRAELDWKRRAEVCQKLRQIAFETNDDELDRFAERLDQRAWDVYIQRVGGGSSLSLDERVLSERLGVDPGVLNSGSKTVPAGATQAKTREDR